MREIIATPKTQDEKSPRNIVATPTDTATMQQLQRLQQSPVRVGELALMDLPEQDRFST